MSKVLQIGDPILRTVARPLSRDEILSAEIQSLIEEMKLTMQEYHGVGLAAPQIGHSLQIVVIEDINHSHLTKEELIERERFPVSFHVIINPKLYMVEGDATFYEGCLSIPHILGKVTRAKQVRVECVNELGETQLIEASGWYARILQHEIDHLQGVLMCDLAPPQSLTTTKNYQKWWRQANSKPEDDAEKMQAHTEL